MKKLFLFDFDGVLVDSLDVYARAIQWSLRKIGMPIVQDQAAYLDLFEDNFYEALQKKGVDLQVFAEALAAYREMAGDFYGDVKPFPFIRPILASLCLKHTLGIVTSNSTDAIERIFAKDDFRGYFQTVLGADFAFSKTEKIAYALKHFQVEPKDTYYIGDTAGDIREGIKAGVTTVAVTWGWHARETLMAANPDILIDRPESLLTL